MKKLTLEQARDFESNLPDGEYGILDAACPECTHLREVQPGHFMCYDEAMHATGNMHEPMLTDSGWKAIVE